MSIQLFRVEVYGQHTVSLELSTKAVIRAKAGDEAFELIVVGKVEAAYNQQFGTNVELNWSDLSRLRLDIP